MLNSAYTWIRRFTREVTRINRIPSLREEQPARERIHAIERYLQVSFPNDPDDSEDIFDNMMLYAHRSPTHCLDVIEAILATNNNVDQVVETINEILIESGSKWIAVKHDDSHPTLEERVDSTAKEAYESAVVASPAVAAGLLKKSWSYAFGRTPNASEAYNYAIKAMEAATWPIVTPSNSSATFGHILGELKANPDKWETAISEKEPQIGIKVMYMAMQNVWEGHTDRHGTATPVQVTQSAAEQAVFVAVFICSCFSRGFVVKR